MALHHYLPATFLARFSTDRVEPRRRRRLQVLDLETKRLFVARASRLGAVNDLYTLGPDMDQIDPDLVDKTWAGYERRLSDGLDMMTSNTDGRIDAHLWARVLVPSVVGLLVRGPDFEPRFTKRIGPLSEAVSSERDNANLARLFELQRLLAPTLAARWVVMHTDGRRPLITNDLGFCGFQPPDDEQPGLAVPLDPQTVLGIIPTRARTIVEAKNGDWFALVEHKLVASGNEHQLNQAIAKWSQRFLFGPGASALKDYLGETQGDRLPPPEPGQFGLATGPLALVHEFTWHRLVSALALNPDEPKVTKFELNWDEVVSDWAPIPMLPTNVPQFPPNLEIRNGRIDLTLYHVPGYTTETRLPERVEQLAVEGHFTSEEAEAARTAVRSWNPWQVLDFGISLGRAGRYVQSSLILREALTVAEEAEDHPLQAFALNNLGMSENEQGHRVVAEDLFHRAISTFEKVLGRRDHPLVADALNNLGIVSRAQGQYELAESFYGESLATREQTLGSEHPDVAESLNTLANLRAAQGRFSEALPLRQRGVEILRQLTPPGEPSAMGMLLTGLGGDYLNLGMSAEAEPALSEAIALLEESGGKDHPSVAAPLTNLAIYWLHEENYVSAEEFGLRALSIRQATLGSEHPTVASSQHILGDVYTAQERYPEAESLYDRALEVLRGTDGEGGDVVSVLQSMAELQLRLEDFTRAERAVRDALELSQSALPPEHPSVGELRKVSGDISRAKGETAVAVAAYKRALEILEPVFGPEHRSVIEAKSALESLVS